MSMTKDQQRISIAEWMGWKFIPSHDRADGENYHALVATPEMWASPDGELQSEPPNYHEDLNAFQLVWQHMTNVQQNQWADLIHTMILGVTVNHQCNLVCFTRVATATAAQRAEAFCRMQWPERWQGGL
jgi:hypothetical protein